MQLVPTDGRRLISPVDSMVHLTKCQWALRTGVMNENVESPHFLFQFWNLVLEMEPTLFTLIWSFRDGNFQVHCHVLQDRIPYFSNSNVNYALWFPSYLHDMVDIEQQEPLLFTKEISVSIKAEWYCAFLEMINIILGLAIFYCQLKSFGTLLGNLEDSNISFQDIQSFVCALWPIAVWYFRSIAQDHAHNNVVMRWSFIGLLEDPTAVWRWMVMEPQVSPFVAGYKAAIFDRQDQFFRNHLIHWHLYQEYCGP